MRAFRKCCFFLSDWIKSYGQLSEILAYFSRFYNNLSLIILKSRDHGCRFWEIFNFTWFLVKFKEQSQNFQVLAQNLWVMERNLWEGSLKTPLDRIGYHLNPYCPHYFLSIHLWNSGILNFFNIVMMSSSLLFSLSSGKFRRKPCTNTFKDSDDPWAI